MAVNCSQEVDIEQSLLRGGKWPGVKRHRGEGRIVPGCTTLDVVFIGRRTKRTEAFPTVECLMCKTSVLFVAPGLDGGVRAAKTWERPLLSRGEETLAR